MKLIVAAWSRDRLLLARIDGVALPVGLRDQPCHELRSDQLDRDISNLTLSILAQQRQEQQEAEKREPVRPARLSRKQWAGLKRALAFDREKRTPSVDQLISDLRGGRINSLRPTLIATGIVAVAITVAGIGYTLWTQHGQEPVASISTPSPLEASRRDDSATIKPEISAHRLPQAVEPTRPPQAPTQIPETPSVLPGSVVERVLSNVRCSALAAVVDGRTLVVEGYFGDRQSLAAALEPLAKAAGSLAVSVDQVREMDPLYCRPLEVLRPFVEANRDRNLSLAVSNPGTDGRFHKGDQLVLTIKAPPGRMSYLYVDYFSLDGNVVHMLPSPASRDNRLAASGQTTLGNGGRGGSWTVGEPFGTELIAVTLSPKPLFAKARPEVEAAAGYLADLQKSLARVGMDAGTAGIAAAVSFIHTERPERPPEAAQRDLFALEEDLRQREAEINRLEAEVNRLKEELRKTEERKPWLLWTGGAGGAIIGFGAYYLVRVRRQAPRPKKRVEPDAFIGVPSTLAAVGESFPTPQLPIFVSYSRKDEPVVQSIVQELRGSGYAVWIDFASQQGMQRFAGSIVAAIRGCRVFALVGSRNAFASDHVIREVYVAGDFKKPFLVFEIDMVDFPDDVLYFISGFPRVSMTDIATGKVQGPSPACSLHNTRIPDQRLAADALIADALTRFARGEHDA